MRTAAEKISRKLSKASAKMAMAVTSSTANSACAFITHQPKMPANAKKLRKF